MKYKSFFIAIFIINLMIFAPVSGTNTFKYALTQEDITQSGFILQNNTGNETTSRQTWETPSDNYSSTVLNVTLVDSAYINNLWAGLSFIGAQSMSFKGADKALNASFFGYIYYATKGNYLINIVSLFSNFSDIKTLMEAQLAILPGHKSSPGFTLPLALISFCILALIISKKRKIA